MSRQNIICVYCKEYREYCACERKQLPPTLEDVHQTRVDIEKLEKKVDRVLEILEGRICSNKIEL